MFPAVISLKRAAGRQMRCLPAGMLRHCMNVDAISPFNSKTFWVRKLLHLRPSLPPTALSFLLLLPIYSFLPFPREMSFAHSCGRPRPWCGGCICCVEYYTFMNASANENITSITIADVLSAINLPVVLAVHGWRRSWSIKACSCDRSSLLLTCWCWLLADACRCASSTAARTKIRHQSARVQRRRRPFTREIARHASANAQLGNDSFCPNDVTSPGKAGTRPGHCPYKISKHILFNMSHNLTTLEAIRDLKPPLR